MAGVVHIAWYATGFRGDQLERALADVSAIALRYGALDFEVQRSREDPYKFRQTATWADSADFYAY